MNRVNHLHVCMAFGNAGQCLADLLKTLAEVLTPVTGDQHQPFGRINPAEFLFKLLPQQNVGNDFLAHLKQRVNHGVACDMNRFWRHAFF